MSTCRPLAALQPLPLPSTRFPLPFPGHFPRLLLWLCPQARFTLRAIPPLPSFIATGGKSGPLLKGRSRRRSRDARDSSPCAHTREARCPRRVGTASPPPQQVLTVNWAWPGRDYRGQCTGPCLMETSSQEGELTKRKKEEAEEEKRIASAKKKTKGMRRVMGLPAQLSENVVNRMKDPGQPSRVGPLTPAAAALVSSEGREKESKSRRPESGGGRRPSGAEVDLLKRCDRGQAVVQDELLQVVTRDTEAAAKPRSASLRQGEGGMDPETHRSAQLAGELESREAELRRRDALYKEQLGRLERQNVETYRLSSQQFHKAASKMEGAIKPRRVEPVCSGLQAQILRCYREHLQEVLLCADLAKAYQHCVSSAHKG